MPVYSAYIACAFHNRWRHVHSPCDILTEQQPMCIAMRLVTGHRSILQHTAPHWNTLKHTSDQCMWPCYLSISSGSDQCIGDSRDSRALQHAVARSNTTATNALATRETRTLRYTATRCDTLQHTAAPHARRTCPHNSSNSTDPPTWETFTLWQLKIQIFQRKYRRGNL